MDDLVLCNMSSGMALRSNRSRARIGQDGTDVYTLIFFEQGECRLGSSDHGTRIGDLVVLDMGQPHMFTMTGNQSLCLNIPRRLLTPLLKEADGHNMRVLPAGDALVALLHNHMRTLSGQAPAMSLAQAHATVGPTLQLAAAALNGGFTEEAASALQGVQTEQIRRFIDDHILDPAPTPESIASAFGISLRKLYYLFKSHGGVAAYTQRKRLHLVLTAITDPAQRSRSIHDIAESHGFHHRKNFNAAFRQAFDMTPREARAFALERRVSARSDNATMWDWIRDLR
jgi:AraC-like DNA-binding protein